MHYLCEMDLLSKLGFIIPSVIMIILIVGAIISFIKEPDFFGIDDDGGEI